METMAMLVLTSAYLADSLKLETAMAAATLRRHRGDNKRMPLRCNLAAARTEAKSLLEKVMAKLKAKIRTTKMPHPPT